MRCLVLICNIPNVSQIEYCNLFVIILSCIFFNNLSKLQEFNYLHKGIVSIQSVLSTVCRLISDNVLNSN